MRMGLTHSKKERERRVQLVMSDVRSFVKIIFVTIDHPILA